MKLTRRDFSPWQMGDFATIDALLALAVR